MLKFKSRAAARTFAASKRQVVDNGVGSASRWGVKVVRKTA